VSATFQGYPTFTPDGHFCLGPVPGVRGLVMAAGCCAHGVSGSAGLGTTVAAAILDEEPLVDLGPVRAGRFAGAVEWDGARHAAERVYADYYGLAPEFTAPAAPAPQRP